MKSTVAVSHHGHEHEFEPQHGLPERLPQDERLIWQGSPDWRMLARRAFHLRGLALYFAVLVGWQAWNVVGRGETGWQMAQSMAWTLALSSIALGLVVVLARLSARTTVYTLTDKRIVMRVGIVLTMSFNLPLKCLASAGLHLDSPAPGATGDIPLQPLGNVRIPYLQLWPHARPWKVSQPHPMLRSVPDAARVGAQIAAAWQAATGLPTAPEPAPVPGTVPSLAGSAASAASAATAAARSNTQPLPEAA